MKKIIMVLFCTLQLLAVSAQQDTALARLQTTVGGTIVSKYMWRGLERGAMSIQPEVAVEWNGLRAGLMGSAGVTKDDKTELNVSLGYSLKGVNVGVTDFWRSGTDVVDRYFQYEERKTGHRVEANVGYSCQWFSLQGYCSLLGNDFRAGGSRAYSTYIELGVPFRLAGAECEVRVGMTTHESSSWIDGKTYEHEFGVTTAYTPTYLYGDKAACNMASFRATKPFEVKGMRLPVFVELHTNPYMRKASLMLGMGIWPL